MKIAFGCQARVGKDTACNYLQSIHGGVILHFSDPLYEILYSAQDIAGISRHKDPKFLQWVGTEWGRSQNPNIWIDKLVDKIPKHNETPTSCFIADLRFYNEAQILKNLGFKLVKIIKNDRTIDRSQTHISENELDSHDEIWDYIIYNNGNLNDFYKQLDQM